MRWTNLLGRAGGSAYHDSQPSAAPIGAQEHRDVIGFSLNDEY